MRPGPQVFSKCRCLCFGRLGLLDSGHVAMASPCDNLVGVLDEPCRDRQSCLVDDVRDFTFWAVRKGSQTKKLALPEDAHIRRPVAPCRFVLAKMFDN